MWIVEYYRTMDGECQTEDFLAGLEKISEIPFVSRKLALLEEYGNQLRRPNVENLGDGIYELRIPVKRRQIRLLYFFFYQDSIVISHGLIKEDKVPQSEINKAKRHRTDYFSKHKRTK